MRVKRVTSGTTSGKEPELYISSEAIHAIKNTKKFF